MAMDQTQKQYPDISVIIARKEQGRRDIAALSFGEKIARLEALRERLAPFHQARRERAAARTDPSLKP